ncbi:SLAP domain-containing protein, partial [Lactobacillus crispatus]
DLTVSAIQTAVDEASDTKGKPDYYNASDKAKKAYDEALNKAKSVLADPNATQDKLDEANSALTSAQEGLKGVATAKDALQSAVKEADTVKAANSKASEVKQKAYQDAIDAGKAVINDGKASQADVNTALSKIDQAKKDLTVSAIQTAVDEASDTKGKPDYYNASDKAKKAYDEALNKAKSVLADPNATQDKLDEANSALTSAQEGLKGVATAKDALQSAVKEANTTKLDDKYYNASQDKKQAYDEALAQAAKLLNDKTASQKAIDDAVANLEKAKAELNGEPNFIGGDYTPSEPSTPSTETPAEKTTEKILMHASYLYDNKGIKIDKPTVKSYVTVVVAETPVTINGIKYYKVAGKDEYIKAGNIDGTLRVITHNSYIYNNKGKATRNKGIKRLVKKTRIVRTYGAPINIKGHMMYRIAKNRYIKARNFEGTLRRLSHNSFVYDENGKATRNKGIRRLLKKSRVVRTFDAPVKINGHMMYRVDNGYVKVKNFK